MTPQDNVIDPFLQKILISRRNDPHARGIMESIQKKQNQIIYDDFSNNIIVQGCAGSGKTVILFHRLANMEYNIPDFKIEDAVFIAPNDHFKEYIDSFVKSLDIVNMKMLTFEKYLKTVKRYRKRTIESIIEQIETSNKAEKALEALQQEKFSLVRNQIDRKKAIRDAYLSEYLTNKNLPNHTSYAAFEKQENPNIVRAYNIIVSTLAKTDDEYASLEKQIDKINYKSKALKNKIVKRKKYKYVFVDEGQDYTKTHYRLLKALNPDAVFNIFGDIKQQLNGNGLRDWDSITSLFDPIHIYHLTENYRNSREIVNYVLKKLGKDYEMLNMGPSMAEVAEISIDEIAQYIQYETKIMGNDEIAIVVDDTNKRVAIKKSLAKLNLDETIKYYTVEEIKGMEYDAVFVCLTTTNKNAIYVAYTRAVNVMYIID